jgi:hypothetical protein
VMLDEEHRLAPGAVAEIIRPSRRSTLQ